MICDFPDLRNGVVCTMKPINSINYKKKKSSLTSVKKGFYFMIENARHFLLKTHDGSPV